jgi:hypothetical protein
MPIHKQLRKRVDARSEDVVNKDVADAKSNAPQPQPPPPSEETSVISDDYSDRGSRKPAYQIGTKVKKVRAYFIFVDGDFHVYSTVHGENSYEGPIWLVSCAGMTLSHHIYSLIIRILYYILRVRCANYSL